MNQQDERNFAMALLMLVFAATFQAGGCWANVAREIARAVSR